jgi:hypothetical protein
MFQSSRSPHTPWLSLCSVLLLSSTACGPAETGADAVAGGVQSEVGGGELEQAFMAGAVRGHEDLVRYGVELANAALASSSLPGAAPLFTPVIPGDGCGSSTNPLIEGNCATDLPDRPMKLFYADRFGPGNWGSNPSLQNLHFLRNHVGDAGLETARATCFQARERIVTATRLALSKWRARDGEGAQYWAGHATHTIQDSFSAAHTARRGQGLKALTEVCSYGRKGDGICFHRFLDKRDSVWSAAMGCGRREKNSNFACLTPEAQASVYATAGYLRTVGQLVRRGPSADVDAALTAYFESDDDAYSSFFRCDSLD